jgi:hypothetical protein
MLCTYQIQKLLIKKAKMEELSLIHNFRQLSAPKNWKITSFKNGVSFQK